MMYVKDLLEAINQKEVEVIVTKVNGIPVVWEPFNGEGAGIYKVSGLKVGIGQLRIEIVGGTGVRTQGYTRDGKTISRMNADELRAYAVLLGADGKRLYGTSKDTLKMICSRLERESDGRC